MQVTYLWILKIEVQSFFPNMIALDIHDSYRRSKKILKYFSGFIVYIPVTPLWISCHLWCNAGPF